MKLLDQLPSLKFPKSDPMVEIDGYLYDANSLNPDNDITDAEAYVSSDQRTGNSDGII